MFIIIKNYRKMVFSFIRNEFAGGQMNRVNKINDKKSENIDNNKSENKKSFEEQFRDAIGKDGIIDKNELNSLHDTFDKEKNSIVEGSKSIRKDLMKQVYVDILKDGYTINNGEELNKLILTLKELGIKVINDLGMLGDKSLFKDIVGEFDEKNNTITLKREGFLSNFGGDNESDIYSTAEFGKAINKLNKSKKLNNINDIIPSSKEDINEFNDLSVVKTDNLEMVDGVIKKGHIVIGNFNQLKDKSINNKMTLSDYIKNKLYIMNFEIPEATTKTDSATLENNVSNRPDTEKIELPQEQQKQIDWNKEEFTDEGIYAIQHALISKGANISPNGEFDNKTLAAVKKYSASDGLVGINGLKRLGLVDENNNSVGDLTKDMFKEGKFEKGSSKNIVFKEKQTLFNVNLTNESKDILKELDDDKILEGYLSTLKTKTYGYEKIGNYKLNDTNESKDILLVKRFDKMYVELDESSYIWDADQEVSSLDEIKSVDLDKLYKETVESKISETFQSMGDFLESDNSTINDNKKEETKGFFGKIKSMFKNTKTEDVLDEHMNS